MLPIRRELLDTAREPLLRHREGRLLRVRLRVRLRLRLRLRVRLRLKVRLRLRLRLRFGLKVRLRLRLRLRFGLRLRRRVSGSPRPLRTPRRDGGRSRGRRSYRRNP